MIPSGRGNYSPPAGKVPIRHAHPLTRRSPRRLLQQSAGVPLGAEARTGEGSATAPHTVFGMF